MGVSLSCACVCLCACALGKDVKDVDIFFKSFLDLKIATEMTFNVIKLNNNTHCDLS